MDISLKHHTSISCSFVPIFSKVLTTTSFNPFLPRQATLLLLYPGSLHLQQLLKEAVIWQAVLVSGPQAACSWSAQAEHSKRSLLSQSDGLSTSYPAQQLLLSSNLHWARLASCPITSCRCWLWSVLHILSSSWGEERVS